MPTGGTQPDTGLPQAVFNALHAMGYDASKLAFTSQGKFYFMFQAHRTDANLYDRVQWGYEEDNSSSAPYPKAFVPQLTADVIRNGTFNQQDEKVTYQGQPYRIRLKRDGTGRQVAEAYVVT